MNARAAALAVVTVGAAFMAARAWAVQRAQLEAGDESSAPEGGGITVWLGIDRQGVDVGPAAPYPVPGVGEFLGIVSNLTAGGEGVTQAQAQANVAAFLAMIRKAEGTAGPDGYRTLFGGSLFESFNDHPRVRFYERADEFIRNGRKDYTTAAGAYQITETTFNALARRLGVAGFSPEVQDAMAVELIREAGALEDVRAGRLQAALNKVGRIWASLPTATTVQPKRSLGYVQAAYTGAGGALA